jgi:hypothetical protein
MFTSLFIQSKETLEIVGFSPCATRTLQNPNKITFHIIGLQLGVLNERSASRASSGSARISSTRILNEALREHRFLARIINEASSARLD